MPWTSIDDLPPHAEPVVDTNQWATKAHRQLEAPAGAEWPRACVRPYQDGWVAKVWLAPGKPARRKGLLIAGWHSRRDDALEDARLQVGILRHFPDRGGSQPGPKQEPPC